MFRRDFLSVLPLGLFGFNKQRDNRPICVGDRVETTGECGPKITGTVLAISTVKFWETRKENVYTGSRYAKICPSWKDSPLYMVELDNPQRSVTELEFNNFKSSDDKRAYEDLPIVNAMSFPEFLISR